MHNICMNNFINPQELRALIKQHGLLQSIMAKDIGLSQGQVSRLVSGNFKKPGRAYGELCIYVLDAVQKVKPAEIQENRLLVSAIASVWDGSAEQAGLIAQVIRSLGPLCKKAI